MEGGIGNSDKRVEQRELRFGRPTIGRLGIGMLGIAQICGSFVVTSQPLFGTGFRARVRLYDQAKTKWDEPSSGLVHDARTKLNDEEVSGKIVDVGTYDFEDSVGKRLPRGTRIIADDITPTFTQAFQESLKIEGYREVPLEWKLAVTRILNHASSLQLLGDYWRLLWELAAACPVPYIADDALPRAVVKERNAQLESFKFSLYVDSRQLFKPVYLKGNPGGYTTAIIGRKTKTVYRRPLTFSGYIVVQEGKQLQPDELRGILVRIKNVGIGYYDPSMLDYRVNHGPRSRWVTGEIFIEEGLEDALNIDRDSFNRFHPEFRALQSSIHTVLQEDIFPEVYRKLDARSEDRQREKSGKREKVLRDVVREHDVRPIKIVRSAALVTGPKDQTIYSSAHRSRDSVEVTVPKVDDLPTSKSTRQLAQSILTIFELALLETDRDAQRKKFSSLLFNLLKRW